MPSTDQAPAAAPSPALKAVSEVLTPPQSATGPGRLTLTDTARSLISALLKSGAIFTALSVVAEWSKSLPSPAAAAVVGGLVAVCVSLLHLYVSGPDKK